MLASDGSCTNRLGSLTAAILHFLTPLFSSSTDCQPAAGQSDRSSHCHIRAAQPGDLAGLAELLADSFHSQHGILGWAYPLLRLGIYEDLRNRLRSTSPHHICLVAFERAFRATEEGDPVFSCVFKTELATHLLQLTSASISVLIGPTYVLF